MGHNSTSVNNLRAICVVLAGGMHGNPPDPGAGTKRHQELLAAYRDRLACVRYRYDSARGVRHKTVELIIDTLPWKPRARVPRREPQDMVGLRIGYAETELRERIKNAGAIWRLRQRLWEIDWKTVRDLGLQARVVDDGRP